MLRNIEKNRRFPNRRKLAAFLTGLALVGVACSSEGEDSPEFTATSTTVTTEVTTTTEVPVTVPSLPSAEVIEADSSIGYPVEYSKQDFLDLLTESPRFVTEDTEVHTSIAILPGVMLTLDNGDKIARPILAYQDARNIESALLTGTNEYGLPTYDLTQTTAEYADVRMLYFDGDDVRSFGAQDIAKVTVTARPPVYIEQGIELGLQFAQVLRVGENGLIARDDCNDPDFSTMQGSNYVEIDDRMVAVGAIVDSESAFTERRGLGGVNGTCAY